MQEINHPALSMDPVLKSLYGAFGQDTVLVPLGADGQTPANKNWAKFTTADTRSAAHMNALWNNDPAVVCGPASGNLCGVRFDDPEAAAEFTDENIELPTLTTHHPEGVCFWFRIKGFFPATQRLSNGLWQSSGIVRLFDRKPHGYSYEILRGGPPAEIEFQNLNWDATATALFLPQIVAANYGGPMEPDANGRLRANPMFMARLYAVESKLNYDATNRVFAYSSEANQPSLVGEEHLKNELARFVMRFNSVPGCAGVAPLAQPQGLRKLVDALRIVAASAEPPRDDIMTRFIEQFVSRDDSSTATTEELYAAFAQFCRSEGLSPMPYPIFARAIGKILEPRFGVVRSHSVVRAGRDHRGFYKIRLLETPPGTLGTPGTPPFIDEAASAAS